MNHHLNSDWEQLPSFEAPSFLNPNFKQAKQPSSTGKSSSTRFGQLSTIVQEHTDLPDVRPSLQSVSSLLAPEPNRNSTLMSSSLYQTLHFPFGFNQKPHSSEQLCKPFPTSTVDSSALTTTGLCSVQHTTGHTRAPRIWHERPSISIKNLLPELLTIIFTHLDLKGKGRAARVCRIWREACYQKCVWTGVYAKLHVRKFNPSVFQSLVRRGIKRIQVRSAYQCELILMHRLSKLLSLVPKKSVFNFLLITRKR